AESSFTATISDTDNTTADGLPGNIEESNDPGVSGAEISSTEPTAADNCEGSSIAQTGGLANGSVFPVGTSTVTYTVTDAAGNDVESSFTVTVTDDENPEVTTADNVMTTTSEDGVGNCTVKVE